MSPKILAWLVLPIWQLVRANSTHHFAHNPLATPYYYAPASEKYWMGSWGPNSQFSPYPVQLQYGDLNRRAVEDQAYGNPEDTNFISQYESNGIRDADDSEAVRQAEDSNGAGGTAFRYVARPSASNSYGYYPRPGGGLNLHNQNWYGGHDGTESFSLVVALEKLFDEFSLDRIMFDPIAKIIGLGGVKGAVGLVKLGFFLALLIVPVVALTLVPLTALVVILILNIPIPVFRPVVSKRIVENSVEAFSERLLAAEGDCVERFSCKLAQLSKNLTKDNWINKVTANLPSSGERGWTSRLSRGLKKGISSTCEVFKCDPYKIVKKFL